MAICRDLTKQPVRSGKKPIELLYSLEDKEWGKKYRVVIKQDASGNKLYYPQKKFFIFWFCFREVRDISMAYYKVIRKTFAEAKSVIDFDIRAKEQKILSKIIRTTYVDI